MILSGLARSYQEHQLALILGTLALSAFSGGVGKAIVIATQAWGGEEIVPWFQPPAEYANLFGIYRSALYFDDGTPAKKPLTWARRRQELLEAWHGVMGPWPKVLERGRLETITSSRREGLSQNRVTLEIDRDKVRKAGCWFQPVRALFPRYWLSTTSQTPALVLGRNRCGILGINWHVAALTRANGASALSGTDAPRTQSEATLTWPCESRWNLRQSPADSRY